MLKDLRPVSAGKIDIEQDEIRARRSFIHVYTAEEADRRVAGMSFQHRGVQVREMERLADEEEIRLAVLDQQEPEAGSLPGFRLEPQIVSLR